MIARAIPRRRNSGRIYMLSIHGRCGRERSGTLATAQLPHRPPHDPSTLHFRQDGVIIVLRYRAFKILARDALQVREAVWVGMAHLTKHGETMLEDRVQIIEAADS